MFTSLATSGMLDTLLERGYEYLFLSNSDNLGAVLEPRILTGSRARSCRSYPRWWTAPRPTARAATSRAARDDGGLVLRETAQVPDEDQEAFEDIERHRFFNANNIWVNLRALRRRSTSATACSGCR